jgi:hypothetical protein
VTPRRILVFSLLLFLVSVIPGTAAQRRRAGKPFTPVVFRPKSDDPNVFEAVVGRFRLVLHEPDAPVEPTSWESPLTVVNLSTGKSYDTDVSAIEQVFLAMNRRVLVVVAGGDGARASVSFIEMATGRAKFPKLVAVSDGTSVEGNRIIFDSAVEKPDADGASLCHAARIYRFDGIHPPMLLGDPSTELTKRQVGVAFVGERRVAFPKTERAALVD